MMWSFVCSKKVSIFAIPYLYENSRDIRIFCECSDFIVFTTWVYE